MNTIRPGLWVALPAQEEHGATNDKGEEGDGAEAQRAEDLVGYI